MCVHDVPTFKATHFAPPLNSLRKKFPGDFWPDAEPGRQAVHENFAIDVIKATHSLSEPQARPFCLGRGVLGMLSGLLTSINLPSTESLCQCTHFHV